MPAEEPKTITQPPVDRTLPVLLRLGVFVVLLIIMSLLMPGVDMSEEMSAIIAMVETPS